MGAAALKLVEPEFDGGDGGGGPFSKRSNADIFGWLRDALDLAGCDPMWDKVYAEMKRRGLRLY